MIEVQPETKWFVSSVIHLQAMIFDRRIHMAMEHLSVCLESTGK